MYAKRFSAILATCALSLLCVAGIPATALAAQGTQDAEGSSTALVARDLAETARVASADEGLPVAMTPSDEGLVVEEPSPGVPLPCDPAPAGDAPAVMQSAEPGPVEVTPPAEPELPVAQAAQTEASLSAQATADTKEPANARIDIRAKESASDAESWVIYTYDAITLDTALALAGIDTANASKYALKSNGCGAWLLYDATAFVNDPYDDPYDDPDDLVDLDAPDVDEDEAPDDALEDDEDIPDDGSEETDSDSFIHQTDYMSSGAASTEMSDKPVWTTNIYTTSIDQRLVALFCETTLPNTTVTLDVYLLGERSVDPTDGLRVIRKVRTFASAGKHRLALKESEQAIMRTGQRFSVVSSMWTEGADGKPAYYWVMPYTSELGPEPSPEPRYYEVLHEVEEECYFVIRDYLLAMYPELADRPGEPDEPDEAEGEDEDVDEDEGEGVDEDEADEVDDDILDDLIFEIMLTAPIKAAIAQEAKARYESLYGPMSAGSVYRGESALGTRVGGRITWTDYVDVLAGRTPAGDFEGLFFDNFFLMALAGEFDLEDYEGMPLEIGEGSAEGFAGSLLFVPKDVHLVLTGKVIESQELLDAVADRMGDMEYEVAGIYHVTLTADGAELRYGFGELSMRFFVGEKYDGKWVTFFCAREGDTAGLLMGWSQMVEGGWAEIRGVTELSDYVLVITDEPFITIDGVALTSVAKGHWTHAPITQASSTSASPRTGDAPVGPELLVMIAALACAACMALRRGRA